MKTLTETAVLNPGQKNSARFFIPENVKIHSAVLFFFFISLAVLFCFNRSNMPYIIFTSAVLLLANNRRRFSDFILNPLLRFKLFFIFSFSFSLLISHDLESSLMLLIKFIILILLGAWMNALVNFRELAEFSNNISVPCLPFFNSVVKKIILSFILAAEHSADLISDILLARKNNVKTEASGDSLMIRNKKMLITYFIQSFKSAENLEKREHSKDLSKSQESYRFNISDRIVFFCSLVVLTLIPFLK